MGALNDFLLFVDSYIGSASWFAYALLGTGLFFTIYLRFPQFRFFRHAIRITRGRYDRSDLSGDTTHFQALSTALSGTVGTGNIAGVALALHLGGPSAVFWMILTALLGMTTKMVEVTLSHKYRERAQDGTMAGGPMYYMKNAHFTLFGRRIAMGGMAALFAAATVICSFGTGNLPQINSIADAMNEATGLTHWITGLVLSILLALVIIGGIKRIAAVAERLVPTMAIVYFIGCLFVLFHNYTNIIPSIIAIGRDLFSGSAATGGFLGASIAFAFQKGVGRGLFSNEAGQGSAPIAHASARANNPLAEGMVALLEPFIDTILICSLTALTLLSSGVWNSKHLNTFESTELSVLAKRYDESIATDQAALRQHLLGEKLLPMFNGQLKIKDGHIQTPITLLHARSVAENIRIYENNAIYTGNIEVQNGKIVAAYAYRIEGLSLIHSAPLTTLAFTKSWLGEVGKYIVSFALLLFAFSTAISWSYYGDRAISFLFSSNSVWYYRIAYVSLFFIGSFIDTKIVWNFAAVAIAVMTLPNLLGILWLRKEVRECVGAYGRFFEKHYPGQRHPRFD